MNINIYWGILTVIFCFGMVFCLKIPGRSLYRYIISSIVILGSVIPVFPENTSLVGYVYGLTDVLSIPLIIWLGSLYFRKIYPVKNEKWLILTTGVLLYASTLGYLPFVQVYSAGYSGFTALLICLFLSGLVSSVSRIVIVFSWILFMAGAYINIFDALMDPILWFVCFVDQIRCCFSFVWYKFTNKIPV